MAKMDINRKICMIVHQFPPDLGITAYRMSYRVQYLRAQGFQVDVFAPGSINFTKILEDGAVLHRVTAIGSKGSSDLDYTKTHAIKEESKANIFAPLRGFIRWLPPLVKELRQFRGENTILYSYNNPVSLHLAALIVRKKFSSWVCEFRDPIAGYEYSQRGVLGQLTDRWLEKMILKHANVICMRAGIQTTPEDYPTAKGRVVLLPDYGVNLESFKGFENKSKINNPVVGVFAGTVFSDITFGPLSEALENLNGSANKLSIQMFGAKNIQHSLYGNLDYRGQIDFEDLLQVYKDSDFLIIYDQSGNKSSMKAGFIPSKLSELIAACRPVLFIGNIESRTAAIITRLEIGICAENKADAIRSAINRIIDGLKNSQFDLHMNAEKLKLIDAKSSEKSFADLLNAIPRN